MISRMRLSLSAVIIIFIILIAFAFSVPRTRDADMESLNAVATTTIPLVSVKDSYRKGVHTISGAILAPNACRAVTSSASLAGDATSAQSILVSLTVEGDSDICLELPSEIEFETTIEAAADLPITVTINGVHATTTPS
jgi:hypothetical protein